MSNISISVIFRKESQYFAIALNSKKRKLKTFSQNVGQQQTVNKWQFEARESDGDVFDFGILMGVPLPQRIVSQTNYS